MTIFGGEWQPDQWIMIRVTISILAPGSIWGIGELVLGTVGAIASPQVLQLENQQATALCALVAMSHKMDVHKLGPMVANMVSH